MTEQHLCPMDGMPLSRVVSEIGQPTEYYHRNGEWHYDRTVQLAKDVQWTTVEGTYWPLVPGVAP